MAEKRIINRKRKRLRVRFGIDEAKRISFTDDISDAGLFITTAMPEKPGTIVLLEIDIPGSEVVKCRGQVRWARKVPASMLRIASKGGMGVKLGHFTQGKEAYRQLVEQLRY